MPLPNNGRNIGADCGKFQQGSNILLDRMLRHARLADFGLAKDQVGKTHRILEKVRQTTT